MLVVAGLALGYGVLSKDVLFVCTVAPVVLAVLWRRTLPLRDGGGAGRRRPSCRTRST